MTRYMVHWKIVNPRLSEHNDIRLKQETNLLQIVQNSLKVGMLKEFGVYLGGYKGYGIFEGTENELTMELLKYAPFVEFEIHPILTAEQYMEDLKRVVQPISV